jgi:putative Holliday junction resolvase
MAYLLFEFKIGASQGCLSRRDPLTKPPAFYYSPANRGLYHENMRVMALDVGDKTIGVAISDALLLTAQTRPTIRRKNLKSDLDILRGLVAENEVHEIVVGQPLHMNGKESRQSQKVACFAGELQKKVDIPIVFWDERLTSFAAEQHLEEMGLNWRKRREHVDKIAAMIILQNYLDSRPGRTA